MLSPDTEQYAGDGQPPANIESIVAAATRAQRLGFDGVTAPEAGHDPFLPLAIAAEHTDRIALGTNVAIAFPRSPLVTAQVAWDLQQLSTGRFRLGLGTQVRSHVERRYAATWTGPPGPRLRDYVLCLQAMFRVFQEGGKPDFEGTDYRFTLMNPFFNPGPIDHPHVPVHVAAVNPYMARLAGELCDGLRLHPIATFRFTREVVLPAVAEGAALAGRVRGETEIIGAPFLAVAEDEESLDRAKDSLRQHIAFYSSTPTYHSVLEHHGWKDVAETLFAMSKEGRWKDMPSLIDDDMLDEWAIVATKDDLTSRVTERCTGLFDTVLLDLPADLARDDDWVAETVARLQSQGGTST